VIGRACGLGQDSTDSLYNYQNQDPSVGPVTSGSPAAITASQAIAASGSGSYDQSDYIAEQQYQLTVAQQQLQQQQQPEWIYWAFAAVVLVALLK
jgi:hypothetical protein